MKLKARLLSIPIAAGFFVFFSSAIFLAGSIGMIIGYIRNGLFGLQEVAEAVSEVSYIATHTIYLVAQGKFVEARTYLAENIPDE